jgi:hypothetical protein
VLEYRVILLLRTSAALLALSALALLIRPGTVIGLIGLTSSRELEWGFRLIGLLVASMAALMTLVAAFLGERGLRQTAAILMLTSVSFAILLLFSPGGWGLWHLLLVMLELGFAAGYFFALKGRRRNR